MLKQIGMAGAGGALMGVGFAGGAGVYNYARGNRGNTAAGSLFTDENNRLDEESYSALLTEGLQSENAEIREYAARLGEKRDGVSQKEMGMLYRMLLSEHPDSNVSLDENGQMRIEDAQAASPEISTQEADENAMQVFDGVDAPSSSMQFMAAENYTPERRKTIRDYLQAVNSEFSAFAERVKRGEKTRPWFNLGGVNERTAADVQKLTGVDVSGYVSSITPNDVRHILRRHGENGVADHSMRDVNDLARIEFVMQNYDGVELVDEQALDVRNSDNTPSAMVKFSKKIDGTYYVVEAVPDSNAKRMRVKSAYISAKGESHAAANAEALNTTPEAHLPYSADTYNIAQALGESQEGGGNLQLHALAAEMAAERDEISTAEKMAGDVKAFAEKLGNAGRDVFVSMYDPDMDSAAYLEAMTVYYNAGKNGVALSDVQSQYGDILSQPAREAAHFAGQVDAKALANAASNPSDFAGLVRDAYTDSSWDEQTRNRIDAVAKKLGIRIVTSDTVNGGKANGQYDRKTRTVMIERNNPNPLLFLIGHEITHHLQVTKAYTKFAAVVKRIKGDSFENSVNEVMWAYENERESISCERAEREVIADFAGELFENGELFDEFIRRSNRTTLQKFLDAIKNFFEKIKNVLSKEQIMAFEEVQNKLIKALEESAKTAIYSNNSETSYSIKYTTDNVPVVVIEDDILKGVPKSKWIATVKNTISNKFSGGIPISGRLIKVNRITRNEFTNSEYTKYLRSSNHTVYADKLKFANNLDEIVLSSINYINEDLKHTRKDNIRQFSRGEVLLRIGSNDYSAKVIVGYTSGNSMVLYDIVDFSPKNLSIKKSGYTDPLCKKCRKREKWHIH